MALAGMSVVAPRIAIWGGAVLILFYFLLYFGYYAFFEIWWNGQTPGKRKVGIRVIKDSGRPLTPAESIGRNLMRIVDWMPFFYGVGIVSAFFSKGNKRLGDLLVGSLVVRETSLQELKPVWQTVPVATGNALVALSAAPLGAGRLTAEECALIESFLTRRSSLDYDVRVRMAEEVFRRIKEKLTIPADNTRSVESLLEALSYERRATGHFS
jgi:RDD family